MDGKQKTLSVNSACKKHWSVGESIRCRKQRISLRELVRGEKFNVAKSKVTVFDKQQMNDMAKLSEMCGLYGTVLEFVEHIKNRNINLH